MSKFELPIRVGDAPAVGDQPPQLQFSDISPESIREELKAWSFSKIPNSREHDTLISVPSARALWLDENHKVAHDDAFMKPAHSREYCHIHEDGSMHIVVPEEVEDEVIAKKWGLRHPWYKDGVKEILTYAPRDIAEMNIMKRIIIESYRYASGDLESEISL